jgi:2-iminoacetate synthase ThiH
MIAVSRLMLDNIPNIKAYWIMMGLPLAQVALHFGANDVQGTVVRERSSTPPARRPDRAEDRPSSCASSARRAASRAARHALQRAPALGRGA